uniref:Aminotransferase-like protein n=1 Tax=Oryza sativa subsp. japonica TaxID=39947 RepID=Q6YTZ2_ORYSJ|nr:aminotransferase-like protein [Oryza sativa Japonica Group]BAD17735.1 aminotransferase-like protein [Oryza sativa Japonica Group]
MLTSKSGHWKEIGIAQALALTAANMARNEPMMAASTYFWSIAMNTFLFSQGPMTPTLLDIIMITGLDITSSANLSSLNTQLTHEFKTRSIGGWSGYVAKNMGTGPVTPREHTAFLMMWLEKFLFCGPSCGPTANWQWVAENLVEKKHFPLGKYLLGYLYQTLNTAIDKIASGKTIGTGGPWWLLQIWLNLHTRKVANRPALADVEFPRFEPIIRDDGETSTTCRCMSFEEAASVSAMSKLSAEPFREWFNNFYDGFPKNDRIWFAYEGSASFELPAISPFIIHVGIHQGKNIQMTYEFYHPTSATTESSPPHQSKSGVEIEYALGLLPNGGGLTPPVIGYNAPKTSTLLHGLSRMPIARAAGRKRAKSAAAPSAAKKKSKKQKTAADDLPAIDPDVADFLEDEAMSEEITPSPPVRPTYQPRKKKIASKKPQGAAAPVNFPDPINSLFQFSTDANLYSRFQPPRHSTPVFESSESTPSVIGSHHVEEEEEEVAPTPAVPQHWLKFEKAQKRIADQRERRDLEATIQANRTSINEEKAKLDELEAGPSATQTNIDQLNKWKIELIAGLEQCNAQLALEQEKLADLPKAIEDQKIQVESICEASN